VIKEFSMLKLAIFAALAMVSANAWAQGAAVTPLDHLPSLKGDYFPLHSRAVGHPYHIYVRLPDGYAAEPQRRYPIVYLLDGDSLFPMIAPAHLFLTIDDKLPEAIIVGIAYGSFAKPVNRRHIDFMPPAAGVAPADAGTVQFQRFLETELIPAVEGRYRANPARRILFGQSRAGALVLYSAFTKPDLFWAHVASNPSWDPGGELLFGKPPRSGRKDLRLVVASGTKEYPDRREVALEWSEHMARQRNLPWVVQRIDIPGGTHSAYAPDAYRATIRWLFAEPEARTR
jgi:predicted alpha/beta superfamily hydrolase